MTERERLRNLQRRVSRARNAKGVTCSASMHVHLIADYLSADKPRVIAEPLVIAESLYAVLESLWKLRKGKP